VGSALIELKFEFLTGEVEKPTAPELDESERAARLGCLSGAGELRSELRD
jgi:hypothetical protein